MDKQPEYLSKLVTVIDILITKAAIAIDRLFTGSKADRWRSLPEVIATIFSLAVRFEQLQS
jgi:hypothetical protein